MRAPGVAVAAAAQTMFSRPVIVSGSVTPPYVWHGTHAARHAVLPVVSRVS